MRVTRRLPALAAASVLAAVAVPFARVPGDARPPVRPAATAAPAAPAAAASDGAERSLRRAEAAASAVPAPPAVPAPATAAPAAATAAPLASPEALASAPPLAGTADATSLAAPAAGPAAGPIRVGAIFPLTGPLSAIGQESYQGANVAMQLVNAAGGVRGRPLEWVQGDSQTPAEAEAQVRRLVEQEHVKLLIGSYSSPIALAASRVAEEHRTIYWEEGAWTNALFDRQPRYTFRTGLFSSPVGEAAVKYAISTVAPMIHKAPRDLTLAIVNEDGPSGTSVGYAERVASARARLDYTYITYPTGIADMTAIVQQIKDVNPDIVLATSYVGDSALLLRTMHAMGVHPRAVIGASAGFSLSQLRERSGDLLPGVLVVDEPGATRTQGLRAVGRELQQQFELLYRIATGQRPDDFAYNGFVSAYALFHDVLPNAANADDPEAVRDAAFAADVFEGDYPNGWGLRFDRTGQNYRIFAAVRQWQNGSAVMVQPMSLSEAKVRSL